MFNFFKKRKYRDYDINPDEIFIDTLNVSDFDQQQFEGVLEKPISSRVLLYLGIFFVLIACIFVGRIFQLQIIKGPELLSRSERNALRKKPIFAERGVIYDRNGLELAWNKSFEGVDFLHRDYIKKSGFGHILGYVNYPQQDDNGFYWRSAVQGQAGLEKKYNDYLSGVNGSALFEVNALGEKISENNIDSTIMGKNLNTTLDVEIQHRLYHAIKRQAEKYTFQAGAGGIMNIHSGELIALTSYPEYDPYTLAEGTEVEKINKFFSDPQKPFLNRIISGLYSPGSTVKPFLGLAALDQGLISQYTRIKSTGRISIPNKYNPSKSSIFRDWRRSGHGMSDVKFAIADSVNTFFYAIGGGYKNQKGLGIKKIEEYLREFDIAEKTGIDFGVEISGTIPNPSWKKKHYADGTWRLGDTYNTSIGQFGFQVSPIQMLRATAGLANNGVLVEPLLVKKEASKKYITKSISNQHYQIIKDGMRQTVTKGTAQNLDVPYVKMAAKTGTAQVGVNNEFYHSWIIGFFPYEKPQYAYVVVMERGKRNDKGSASKAWLGFMESVQKEYGSFWDNL